MTDDKPRKAKAFKPDEALNDMWPRMVERMEELVDRDKVHWIACRKCGASNPEPYPDANALVQVAKYLTEYSEGKPGAAGSQATQTPDLDIDYAAMTPEDKTTYRKNLIRLASPHLLSALSGD